jgi:hypothetical protein
MQELGLDQPWPDGADGRRGHTSGNNRVVLPDGWLKDPYDCAGVSADAELDTLGGRGPNSQAKGGTVPCPAG